jgi:hypothetical protein
MYNSAIWLLLLYFNFQEVIASILYYVVLETEVSYKARRIIPIGDCFNVSKESYKIKVKRGADLYFFSAFTSGPVNA